MITRLDHFTIVTDQLQSTHHFYVEILGLHEGPRPPFPIAGYWLYVGPYPALHVIAVERMPEPRRGVLDHMAFRAEGLAATLERLDEYGIAYRIIRAPGQTRTWQLFCNDPNGVEVELDFAETEVAPPDWKARCAV